jgi:DNA-binding transcriptional LysR family regulator
VLDLTCLRVLAAVARLGSVTEAARELNYAQPSVSHHLSRLQAEVGVALTQQAGRGIRLTPASEMLARRAAEILGRVEAAEEEITAITELRTRRVRVAGFQSVLGTLVTEAAAALKASSPGVEISLVDLHPDIALQQLREGIIDVAVVFRYDDTVPEDMRFQHLFDDPMHLFSLQAAESLEDNRDSSWIAGCERCRRELVEACQAVGFSPHIMYTSDDPFVQQALVAAGLGVTTLPGLALEIYRVPGIQSTEFSDFCRRVDVATFGEPPDPPATSAFVRALTEAARWRWPLDATFTRK